MNKTVFTKTKAIVYVNELSTPVCELQCWYSKQIVKQNKYCVTDIRMSRKTIIETDTSVVNSCDFIFKGDKIFEKLEVGGGGGGGR